MSDELGIEATPPKADQADVPAKKRSPARQRAFFLRQFERCGRVAEAAARTGVTSRTVQRWRINDARFAERYDSLLAWRIEMFEDQAYRRAMHPDLKHHFYRGRRIASVERHNDRMLLGMLGRLDRAQQRRDTVAANRALVECVVAQVVEKLRTGS